MDIYYALEMRDFGGDDCCMINFMTSAIIRKWLQEPNPRSSSTAPPSGTGTSQVLRNKLLPILKAVGKLVAANLISLNYTE
jgi:hypothetical protein